MAINKTILVTGCSSGIGLCCVQELKQHDYRIFASARKTEDVEQLQAQGFETVQLDLANSRSIRLAVEQVLEKTGGSYMPCLIMPLMVNRAPLRIYAGKYCWSSLKPMYSAPRNLPTSLFLLCVSRAMAGLFITAQYWALSPCRFEAPIMPPNTPWKA